ncbi:MAG: HPr family phosphocarrier protein [Thermoflexales bacterium]|nr:HPr family phosphocarrier protein [Thermoflexales bacterium]
MLERKVTVGHPEGLHARPAARFVQTARRFRSRVRVLYDGREADAKSLLSLLALGVEQGAVMTIRAEGEDAEQALAALEEVARGQ